MYVGKKDCGSIIRLSGLLLGLASFTAPALAETSNEELAKKLANPIASLISLPIQYNTDQKIGQAETGTRQLTNIQPVIPFSLNDDWNLISRTIVPVISQKDIFAGAGKQSGFGDVIQSAFFSPKQPTATGWIWGAGPVLLLPTASDPLLGAEKWGMGPTAVALKQNGPWTYGLLANHIWSVGGKSSRANINATFLQPFLSYTTPTATTLSLSTESTYDWRSNRWVVPVNLQISQVLKLGGQLISIQAGGRYWAATTPASPKGFGARLSLTFLFPK
ncbi:MAG: transporter [Mariprofundus sp.]